MKKIYQPARAGSLLLLAALCAWLPLAHAGDDAFTRCAKEFPSDNAARLKCYDTAAAAITPAPAATPVTTPVPVTAGSVEPARPEPTVVATADDDEEDEPVVERSYLTRAWNLDNKATRDQSKMGRLVPHHQSYMLLRSTNRVNDQPASPAAGHATTAPYGFDALETKFQLSFKADIGSQKNINFLGLKTLRWWGAYTQQSNWQMFNTRNSSMFRETNYEPELIATFGTGHEKGLKLVNLGLVHQSNGQHLPESRSWNRLYLQGGWEWGNTSVMGRGWWRIPESTARDENPDIVDYIGRAELVARWEPEDKSQAVSVLLRNNLRLPTNRGFVQLDWALPVALGNSARLHAQLTSGFGESLIDYNHRQTTFGLGFSFREW